MKSNAFLKLLVLVLFSITSINAFSQVTIGSKNDPDAQAVLDLQTTQTSAKGLLFPRVSLTGLNDASPFTNVTGVNPLTPGMTVYHTGEGVLSAGIYSWSGSEWQHAGRDWFYMPSTIVNMEIGTAKKLDLYAKYAEQFTATAIKSTGAPDFKYIAPAATEFFYYVIGYDKDVFDNISIDANGEMTYDVTSTATDDTYINIIFIRK